MSVYGANTEAWLKGVIVVWLVCVHDYKLQAKTW